MAEALLVGVAEVLVEDPFATACVYWRIGDDSEWEHPGDEEEDACLTNGIAQPNG